MDGHDRSFESSGLPSEEEHGEHQHPRHPDEESALLSAPETGQREPEWHGVIEVFPNVLELVAVAEDEQVQQGYGRQNAADVEAEPQRPSRIQFDSGCRTATAYPMSRPGPK